MTPGRNANCPCGSGKKYKRCCWREAQFPETKRIERHHRETYDRLDERERQQHARTALLLLATVARAPL